MELFYKLGDTIVSVSKDATQKAKDLSELARIRMEMRAKKDYINKLYLEIGKSYYELHKNDENRDFEEHMQLIQEAQDSLEELNKQSGQIKGTVRCAQCGQDMPLEADFCSKCGSRLEKPQAEDLETIFEDEDIEKSETAEEKPAEEAAAVTETVKIKETIISEETESMQETQVSEES